MKQALAFLFLSCFLIYQFGYYAFYFSIDYHLESKWIKKIYSDASLKIEERTLEIPLSVPYYSNQEEFQLTNAPFERDGEYFRAIKQRYQNDTLQIVYVADTARGILDNAVKKWISFLIEENNSENQSSDIFIKSFLKDYIQTEFFQLEEDVNYQVQALVFFNFPIYRVPFFKLDSPPPQVV